MNEFLKTEYQEAFQHLRYYDERQNFNLKLVITISTSVATVLVAIFKIFEADFSQSVIPISILSFIVFVCLSLIYGSMIQNRLYFTYMARQINAIRKHGLSNYAPDFENNQLYLSTDFSAMKLFSSQSTLMAGVAFLSSCYLGIGTYAFLYQIGYERDLLVAFTISIINLIGQFLIGFNYLSKKSKKSADNAVHNKGL